MQDEKAKQPGLQESWHGGRLPAAERLLCPGRGLGAGLRGDTLRYAGTSAGTP